ncbi:MAG: leucine-rich repeat protein [Bacteroidaceae bacterium]|nr:leucine-rich repeat protein [Bacteroidaceae bacterium]
MNADITSFNELKYFTGLTYIGNSEFYRCSSLTSITIPITVKEIGEYAFSECSSLTSITIPKSVTSIGKTAFSDCSSLTSVTIPKSVTKIESLTFERCTSLTSINIPEGVTSIGYAAFTGCNQLTSVTIPESVTSIDEQAFNGCSSLKYVVVNIKTPLSIHNSTFEGCEKATLFVPTGCKSAYESATYWKNFKNILEIDDSIIIPFADSNVKAICVAKWDTNGDGELSEKEAAAVTGLGSIFSKNAGITSFDELRFFTGLTSVGDSEFYRCSCLTSITIPEGVTSIGGYAFKDCSSLTSITIPEGVTSIGRSAFSGCSNLTSINIPTSVTSIYDYAFSNLSNLASIVIKEGNVKYDSRENCNAIIETSTNTLIAGCKSTIIPESVTKIGDYAFRGCSGLTSIVLPEGVTTIGNFAFYDCGNLESIAIPNSVTRIFGWLLDDCGSLRNIYCYAEQIPYAIGESFKNLGLESVILHVPAASLDAYKTISPWNYFRNIVAIGYEIYATNINLDQTEYALTAEGETVQLNAIIAPDDATFKDVTWTSSDESVATVDGNGLVTAVGDGVAIITATTTDGTDLCTSCMVYVNIAVYATDIYLDQTKYALTTEGETAQLAATIAPDDATFKDVMWTSFDESVATVDENGLVTAVGNGVAIITVTTVDGTDLIASCTVYVSIPIENNTPDVTGKTFTLRCERGYVGYNGSTLCSTTQEAASEFAIVNYGTTNYLYDVTNKAFVVHSTAAMAGDKGNRSLESSTYFAAAVTGLTWGKTGFEAYPWYLEDCFTNWMNMDGDKKVCMNTWKDFEGGNGGNTYQVDIVSTSFDATEAIQMLDNYFQTAVEVTDEQYQAALNSVGTDTQYAIYTLKGGTRYYLTSEGYLTAHPTRDCVLTFARTEGDGLFRSPGWKVDACFTNPQLSENGGASGALLPQGHILTDKQGRDDWEGQVWYLGDNGCYAVRATNAVSDTWGANTYWTVLDTNGDGVPEADYSWAPAFVWQLESDVVSVGIRDIDNGQSNESDAWYTLDGRKLSGKPATKGIYIRNNQKVLVK